MTWGLLTVYNYIKYMAGESEAQLPLFKFINVKLTYGEPPPEEVGFWSTLLKGQFRDLWQLNILKNAITSTFEVGAFFLQFVEAWSAQQSNFSMTALPTVKAPMVT